MEAKKITQRYNHEKKGSKRPRKYDIQISIIDLPSVEQVIKQMMSGIKLDFLKGTYSTSIDTSKMNKIETIEAIKEHEFYSKKEKELKEKDKSE